MGRGAALGKRIDNLIQGDTVTWAVVGTALGLLGLFGLFVLKVKRNMDREDAERGGRHGRK